MMVRTSVIRSCKARPVSIDFPKLATMPKNRGSCLFRGSSKPSRLGGLSSDNYVVICTPNLSSLLTSIETLSKVTVTVVPLSEQTPLLPNINPVVVPPVEFSAVLETQVLYATVVRSIPEKSCNNLFNPSCRDGFVEE